MEIGISVLIFLGVGIVVMALFCLITRYFNKKLQRALENDNQVYSMIEEIRDGEYEIDEDDNQYDKYNKMRENQGVKDKKGAQIEMTEVKQPLNGYGNDIYGMSKLKRRLEGMQQGPIQINPETQRSVNSLKSFRPDKLDSKRSLLSKRSNLSQISADQHQDDIELKPATKKNKKKKQDVTIHQYVSKIVSYVEEGVVIFENNLLSVTKLDGIVEKKVVKKTVVKPVQNSFEDTLEAYGFEVGQYGAYKFVTTLEIPHMKAHQQYPVTALKSTQKKENVEFSEFYSIQSTFEDQSNPSQIRK